MSEIEEIAGLVLATNISRSKSNVNSSLQGKTIITSKKTFIGYLV